MIRGKITITIFLLCLLSAALTYKTGQAMVFPKNEWEVRTPESQWVNADSLSAAIQNLRNRVGHIGNLVVIRNGYMIWNEGDTHRRLPAYSVTKTFTTTVLGLLIGDGRLALDTRAADISLSMIGSYPEVRIRHLASMTSGYDCDCAGSETPEMPWGNPDLFLQPDATRFVPGTKFNYYDPAVHQLGYILTKTVNEPLSEYFRRRIADRIGMQNWEWQNIGTVGGIPFSNPSGIYGTGVRLSARDLARHGHLYLNRGKWKDEQLIASSWIDQATTNQVPNSIGYVDFDRRGRFGYMWWTNGTGPDGKRPWPSAPARTSTPNGAFWNYCFVIPEWNMVIVRTADTAAIHDADWEQFFSILRKGVRTVFPACS